MREINKIFVPVYTELLRNKTYTQRFDSKAIGTMFRVLAANIWRLDSKDTSSRGYRGQIFATLAQEYEAGNLVCYYDDKTLAELLGITPRYVRKLRSQLIELGLVEATQVENGAAKYYYKLGEVIDHDNYGTIHEVLFIDKWLADIQQVNKGRKERAEFEDQLLALKNGEKDTTGDQFSNGTLTELHHQVMQRSNSIFGSGVGTTVPESRNYSSGQEPLKTDDNQGKNQGKNDDTNKMKYKEPLPSKEGIYKKTPKQKRKTHNDSEQYSLFGTTTTKTNYKEKLKVAFTENLNNVPSALLKLAKEDGTAAAKTVLIDLMRSRDLDTVEESDTAFFAKSWETISRARAKLVPQKYLSPNSFLTGWWLMHTLDEDAAGRRKNISRIRAVMGGFVEKISDDIDEIIGAIRYMRNYLENKQGTRVIFTKPEHMYKALETYLTYYRERKAKKQRAGAQQSNTTPETVDIPCESAMLELRDGELDGWTLDTHRQVLKSKKYQPKYLTALSLMDRFTLWKEGFLNDVLVPKKAYKDADIPKSCWDEVAIKEATFVTITYWKDQSSDAVTNECILRKFVEQYEAGTWNPIGVYCTEEELEAARRVLDEVE